MSSDFAAGKHRGQVATRFPPEPNGYLHIGHAKSICLNFGIAAEYGGTCNLRFDDTNPTKEDIEYVEAIKEDVEWLGFEWDAQLFASDYFERLYEFAVELIRRARRTWTLTADEIRDHRGTLTAPGTNSPYREPPGRREPRPVCADARGRVPGRRARPAREDRHGVAEPEHARSDAVPDPPCRAPPTGDAWCIYPMYDFAHPLSDAIEGITHSLCTLEFEDHRPLYDWLVRPDRGDRPQQIEFARLNLNTP